MSGRPGRGRDVAQLLHDFGHDLPEPVVATPEAREPRMFHGASWRGERRRGSGWVGAKAPVTQYQMASDQAPALWPFIAAPGLPPTGAQMGLDELSGGSFYVDPNGWVMNDAIPVTNSNVICSGKPGRGKSGGTKTFCLRMMDFGYRTLILGDVKDEYEKMCRAFGVEPIVIGPGLPGRINPLAFGPLADGWENLGAQEVQERSAVVFGRWLTLIRGLVGSQHIGQQRVPFTPSDETVVNMALDLLTGRAHGQSRLQETTIPRLWELLRTPTPDLISGCRYRDERDFLDQTRLLRDALGRLVNGVLAGLFDDYTNIEIDWRAPIQSLSLARLAPLGEEAEGTALTCMNSWGRGIREITDPGDLRVVVRDEVWKQMRLGPEAVKSFDADLRLSRTVGDIQWANLHKPSDMTGVGDGGSQAVAIAKDLLHLADTKIFYGQDPAVAEELHELFGLGPRAVNLITGWALQARGRAVYMVGDRLYQVQGILHPLERDVVFTNDALTSAA